MPKFTSTIRVRKDLPTLLDDLVHREDIPGTGKMHKELEDLIRGNYLDFHTRGKAVPKLALESIIAKGDLSAWRVPFGASISEGLPVQTVEQTSPAEIKVKPDDNSSQRSVRPDWATLSFQPRLSTSRPVQFLRRRNGKAVAPDFVIGNDDRVVFRPSTWPWLCVGRIFVWARLAPGLPYQYLWSGTGTLVGTNVVLTASHLVPWNHIALGWDFSIRFTPAYYDGISTLGSGVSSWVEEAHGYSNHEQGDDMAVLKLYTPLGNSLGYFGYKTYSDDWEGGDYWTLIGYPGAVGGGERPTKQSNIVITDDDSGGEGVELEHTGDATKGNSGGPLWAWWGDSPRVIGTHSGSEYNWDETNNVAAGGSALSKLIKWARDNW